MLELTKLLQNIYFFKNLTAITFVISILLEGHKNRLKDIMLLFRAKKVLF